MLVSREPSTSAELGRSIHLTTAPGVSVPNVDDLTRKLESTLGLGTTKIYVHESDKWVEVKPSSVEKPTSVIVRSFNEKEGIAYVDLRMHPEYKMPVFQIWHFDGKTWSDRIDRGAFVR